MEYITTTKLLPSAGRAAAQSTGPQAMTLSTLEFKGHCQRVLSPAHPPEPFLETTLATN
jgi:hypothetical protein